MIIDDITNITNIGIYLITASLLVTGGAMFYYVVISPIREVLKK